MQVLDKGWKVRVFYRCLGIGITLLLWQLATSGLGGGSEPGFVTSFSPANTFRQFSVMAQEGALDRHVLPSLGRFAAGLGLALLAGVPMGIVVGYFPHIDLPTQATFQFLRMTSPLAWMPIAILAFGVGAKPVIFLIALAAVWPILLSTAHGVHRVDPQWIKVVRMLGGGDMAVLTQAVIPAVLPDVLNGVRVSVGVAWIVLVPAEMLGVSSGLGYYLLDTRDRFNYGELMAVILVIGALGFLTDSLVHLVQRRIAWPGLGNVDGKVGGEA